MSETIISIQNVSKVFQYSKRQGLKGFLRPEIKHITAVDDISLQIQSGESVAFIGPNGAGKSTTIKMLCGILQPTQGRISVIGLNPLTQRRQLAYQIGTVFGQRSQLIFNLPLIDSLELTAAMYALDPATVKTRIGEVVEQFNLTEFVGQPVRKLSLGQRMRAEIANSLLHNPDIIFLDEPTIGLDVVSKRSLREIIRQTNKQMGTTIFLTSHDVGDIEEVSDRTIIVNHGQIILDIPTDHLKRDYLRNKTVKVITKKKLKEPPSILGVTAQMEADGVAVFSVDTTKHKLNRFLPQMIEELEVEDVTVEDTPLEDIIHELYMEKLK